MTRRWIEFCLLYIGMPSLLMAWPAICKAAGIAFKINIIAALWVMAAVSLVVLRCGKTFDFADFGRVSTVPRREWRAMLFRFGIGAAALTAALLAVEPEALLAFPKSKPGFWLLVMVCYPIFSVLAQGVVFRALYWDRYSRLFPERMRIAAGAAVFAFAHLPYANAYALAFPFIGGFMFLSSYRRTRSLMFAAIEHALYGDFLFTIGWGLFFFHAGVLNNKMS